MRATCPQINKILWFAFQLIIYQVDPKPNRNVGKRTADAIARRILRRILGLQLPDDRGVLPQNGIDLFLQQLLRHTGRRLPGRSNWAQTAARAESALPGDSGGRRAAGTLDPGDRVRTTMRRPRELGVGPPVPRQGLCQLVC
jgi:hypothetical protein